MACASVLLVLALPISCSHTESRAPVDAPLMPAAQQHETVIAVANADSLEAVGLSTPAERAAGAASNRAPVTIVARGKRAISCSMPASPKPQFRAPSTLQCTFVLDPDIPEDAYDAVLLLPDGRTRRRHGIESGRRIRFDDIEEGYVTLVVELWPSKHEIERISSIAVPPASATNDARLDLVDLRGRVHGMRAKLLGAGNETLDFADVWVDDGAGHGWSVKTDADSWLSVFVPTRIAGLDAKVNGYRGTVFHAGETLQLVPD
jgi:hypothetical protein